MQFPATIEEALSLELWKEAMKREMKALERNKTWEIVVLPKGCKTMDENRFIPLSIKLIAQWKGTRQDLWQKVTQTYDVDYQGTFALVAKMSIIQILLSLATNLNWSLQ